MTLWRWHGFHRDEIMTACHQNWCVNKIDWSCKIVLLTHILDTQSTPLSPIPSLQKCLEMDQWKSSPSFLFVYNFTVAYKGVCASTLSEIAGVCRFDGFCWADSIQIASITHLAARAKVTFLHKKRTNCLGLPLSKRCHLHFQQKLHPL